jgi:hypothetical protein
MVGGVVGSEAHGASVAKALKLHYGRWAKPH